ncbi:unnamed protein product, partial [Brassica rapa subsp. narinosa]
MSVLINQMPCIWGITDEFWVLIRGIPPHYLSRAIVDFVGDKLGQVVDVEFDDSTNLTNYVWVL